jgi:hypothetical protein
MHARTLAAALAVVALALVGPSLALDRAPAVWRWLGAFEPGTFAAAEGALRATPPAADELVLIGSSVAVIDVIDGRLGARLGRPVVAAGVMGAPACATAMLAPELVARRPRTVVLVLAPRDLELCRPQQRMGFELGVAWAAAGPWALLSEDRWLAAWLGDWSTLVRHRAALRMLQAGQGPGWTRHPREGGRLTRAEWRQRLALRVREVGALEYDGAGPSVDAVGRLAARLRAVGAELVLVPAPAHPALIAATTGARGTAWHAGHLASVEAAAAAVGARAIPATALGEYEADDFFDPAHLRPAGQARYTEALAEALR